jgi:predicted MPP superfamily phosphohydrolase
MLRNENTTLDIRGQTLTLIGLDDLWSGRMNVAAGFQGLTDQHIHPRIVLAHNPDMKTDLKNRSWDLMLSGHTHGGQVYIPGVGAPVLPVKDRRFKHGLYSWENRQLHISSGVGTSCGVRFNCPPEICHLDVRGSANETGV